VPPSLHTRRRALWLTASAQYVRWLRTVRCAALYALCAAVVIGGNKRCVSTVLSAELEYSGARGRLSRACAADGYWPVLGMSTGHTRHMADVASPVYETMSALITEVAATHTSTAMRGLSFFVFARCAAYRSSSQLRPRPSSPAHESLRRSPETGVRAVNAHDACAGQSRSFPWQGEWWTSRGIGAAAGPQVAHREHAWHYLRGALAGAAAMCSTARLGWSMAAAGGASPVRRRRQTTATALRSRACPTTPRQRAGRRR
jgi:hypothetical protein